jgi:hypothetical protein
MVPRIAERASESAGSFVGARGDWLDHGVWFDETPRPAPRHVADLARSAAASASHPSLGPGPDWRIVEP